MCWAISNLPVSRGQPSWHLLFAALTLQVSHASSHPNRDATNLAEVGYLFGAWLLAAGFNATLTWWGVSVAIVSHTSVAAGAVISNATLTKAVPIFVAIMVWLIRVLIIGTFSIAGDNLFSTADARDARNARGYQAQPQQRPSYPQQTIPAANEPPDRDHTATRLIAAAARPKFSPGAQACRSARQL